MSNKQPMHTLQQFIRGNESVNPILSWLRGRDIEVQVHGAGEDQRARNVRFRQTKPELVDLPDWFGD